jgi:hypothetical protein
MGKKIRIYESEIKRATRRKLMEKILVEDYEMKDTYSKSKFKPTPREKGIEGVFGQYGEDMDPAVIRYMRKNPDHILRRMAKLYPEIYMRHMPTQPDYGDYSDDDDYMTSYGVDIEDDVMGEATTKQVSQTTMSKTEWDAFMKKGGAVTGNVRQGENGTVTITNDTTNESTEKLFKRFLNKK